MGRRGLVLGGLYLPYRMLRAVVHLSRFWAKKAIGLFVSKAGFASVWSTSGY